MHAPEESATQDITHLLSKAIANTAKVGLFRTLRSLHGAEQMIQAETEKVTAFLEKTLHGHQDIEKMLVIPSRGLPRKQVLDIMTKMKETEEPTWNHGQVSGAIYVGDDEH